MSSWITNSVWKQLMLNTQFTVNRCITGHSKDTKETPVSHGSRNSIGSSACEFEGVKFACSSGTWTSKDH
jgi:hypothetical protein